MTEEDVISDKAEREAKKIICKFVEKSLRRLGTMLWLETLPRFLLDAVEKLEKMSHLHLQSDKQLLSEDNEISIFHTNLTDWTCLMSGQWSKI